MLLGLLGLAACVLQEYCTAASRVGIDGVPAFVHYAVLDRLDWTTTDPPMVSLNPRMVSHFLAAV